MYNNSNNNMNLYNIKNNMNPYNTKNNKII